MAAAANAPVQRPTRRDAVGCCCSCLCAINLFSLSISDDVCRNIYPHVDSLDVGSDLISTQACAVESSMRLALLSSLDEKAKTLHSWKFIPFCGW